jgi:hypothetical protein
LLRDALDHSLAAGPIAAVDDDTPALRGQALRDIAPDAIGRAGYENGLSLRGYETVLRRVSWPISARG